MQHLWAMLGVAVKCVADGALPCQLGGLLHKLVVDGLVHKGARACRTALALYADSSAVSHIDLPPLASHF